MPCQALFNLTTRQRLATFILVGSPALLTQASVSHAGIIFPEVLATGADGADGANATDVGAPGIDGLSGMDGFDGSTGQNGSNGGHGSDATAGGMGQGGGSGGSGGDGNSGANSTFNTAGNFGLGSGRVIDLRGGNGGDAGNGARGGDGGLGGRGGNGGDGGNQSAPNFPLAGNGGNGGQGANGGDGGRGGFGGRGGRGGRGGDFLLTQGDLSAGDGTVIDLSGGDGGNGGRGGAGGNAGDGGAGGNGGDGGNDLGNPGNGNSAGDGGQGGRGGDSGGRGTAGGGGSFEIQDGSLTLSSGSRLNLNAGTTGQPGASGSAGGESGQGGAAGTAGTPGNGAAGGFDGTAGQDGPSSSSGGIGFGSSSERSGSLVIRGGEVEIQSGAVVDLRGSSGFGQDGVVELVGGTLRTTSDGFENALSDSGSRRGSFAFENGTLDLEDDGFTVGGSRFFEGALRPNAVIQEDQTLITRGTLEVGTGRSLEVQNDGVVQFERLQIDGTVELTGNTYDGNIDLRSGGTLDATGTLTLTGDITGGGDIIGGETVEFTGTHRPGDGLGSQRIANNVQYFDTSVLQFDVGAVPSGLDEVATPLLADRLVVEGNLFLLGADIQAIVNPAVELIEGDRFEVIDVSGLSVFDFADLDFAEDELGNPTGLGQFATAQGLGLFLDPESGDGNDLAIVVGVAVPEPGMLLLSALASTGLMRRRARA